MDASTTSSASSQPTRSPAPWPASAPVATKSSRQRSPWSAPAAPETENERNSRSAAARRSKMAHVLVTGGSGKLGRAVLADLVAHDYKVLNIDQALPRETVCPTVRIDLSDYGQVLEAMLGAVDEHRRRFDAVVHLAAIPAPGQ